MMEILDRISVGIDGLSGTALMYAGLLAIAGTIAMAVLQVLKELTPIRRAYQRRWLHDWIRRRVEAFVIEAAKTPGKIGSELLTPNRFNPEKVQSMLVELAAGGEANALWDLPIEQMVGQINAAMQIALENPSTHFPVLAAISQGVDIADVKDVLEAADAPSKQPTSLEARNRVAHRIQRNLDGIQIALGSRWKWWMQVAATSLTVLFVEAAIISNVEGRDAATVIVGAILGIVGGYLAPVTRDVVSALQSLRKS